MFKIFCFSLLVYFPPLYAAEIYEFTAVSVAPAQKSNHKAEQEHVAEAQSILLQQAKQAVIADTLYEPEKVRFRHLNVVQSTKGRAAVCGEFDSKNLEGNYVGFKKFAYSSGAIVVAKRLGGGESNLGSELEKQYQQQLIAYRAFGCR